MQTHAVDSTDLIPRSLGQALLTMAAITNFSFEVLACSKKKQTEPSNRERLVQFPPPRKE